MTVNRGPGVAPVAGVGTTTVEHRLQLAGQYAENAPGVPRSGVLAQATTVLVVPRDDGMSWDVMPHESVISRTASEGVYTPTLTGTTNVTTIAAPATDSRWDLLYIKQNDTAKGDADNQAILGVIQGTAAASPSKPTGSLPSGAMVLAESRVFATTTALQQGSNTTSQVWRHTAARGAAIPVRDATERAEITTPAVGQQVKRLDQNGRIETWNGTVWWYHGQTWSFSRGAGSDSTFSGANTGLVSGTITNAPAGKYRIEGEAGLYGATSAVGRVFVATGPSGSSVYYKKRQDLTGTPSTYEPNKRDFVHAGGNLVITVGYDVVSGSASVMSASSGETTVTAVFEGP
ncbi:hypothetical protein [Arthrobacter sp. ISL-72]|uniref:hypothetical protein n=1 Tax=Arthrobacter sp. ISL-72 TaxID=2819114 RepID=UPI001BE6C536|nr:hypothetical protein [Arthrobacter sp. ISL-72]MBT2594726.1 hypothetical protein [Arthrobacter sp. ISL-72]